MPISLVLIAVFVVFLTGWLGDKVGDKWAEKHFYDSVKPTKKEWWRK